MSDISPRQTGRIENLKQKLIERIEKLDEKNARFQYIVASNLD